MDSSFIHAVSVLEKTALGSVKIAVKCFLIFAFYCACYLEIQVSAASLKSTWRNGTSCWTLGRKGRDGITGIKELPFISNAVPCTVTGDLN